MVSNLDTENNRDVGRNNHNDINDQSKDEILDYLMGSKSKETEDREKSFDALRQQVQASQNKIQTKVETRKNNNNSLFLKKITGFISSTINAVKLVLTLAFAKTCFAFSMASKLNKLEVLRPAILLLEKLHSTRINIIDFSPEEVATVKAMLQPVKPAFNKAIDRSRNYLSGSGELAKEYAYNVSDFVVNKFPAYRKTTIGAAILLGCSILTFFSQVTMQANNQKEDVLNSRRLASVNWNVNGQITEQERDNIKHLMSSGTIKVLPTAKQTSSKIKVITDTTKITNKALTPDEPIMVISSNSIKHTVSSGESILSISQKYKVSISDLISSNPDKDLINVKRGDKIAIPVTTDIVNTTSRPSGIYSKIPRNLLASRSISGSNRTAYFNSLNDSSKMMWPVPSSSTVSSPYGPRWGGFHPGIDITAPHGTPIIATKDGVVINSGWSGGYGKCIIIDHGNGISTRYAHASVLLVSPGQPIKAGQVIAKMGSTGWSTGSHLHYEVLVNGRHHNPHSFF
jgi:murein DD-endopeptidase MepM/ murein hydrolase activator NlpD